MYIIEQIVDVEIGRKLGQCTRVRSLVNRDRKKIVENFLKENTNVFVWSVVVMLGIPSSFIMHTLNENPVA